MKKKEEKTQRVYISGPLTDAVTGMPSLENCIAFQKAVSLLRKEGYVRQVNPTRVWVCRWPRLYRILAWITSEHTAYLIVLLYDLWLMLHCDLIYKIPGWRESRGAQIESCIAYHFKVWTVPLKTRERIDKKLVKAMTKWRARYAESAALKTAEQDEDATLKCGERDGSASPNGENSAGEK